MTQISRPQPEHQNNGYLDSGPYSADQWAELYKALFTGDNAASQGVLANVLNMLAVTNPSGSNIQVNTGWGICNGHLLKNDAAVTFTPPNPSGNPRIDVVVLVQNNTAVARTAGIASGNSLVFPTSVTDYGGLSSLPPYTCRLAILRGSPAASPTAPTLDVDTATLFMVPLAQYQISTSGTISALTDRREYALQIGTKQAGAGILQFTGRQGGNASNWNTGGNTNYTPGATLLQMGSRFFASNIAAGGGTGTLAITYPIPFSDNPNFFPIVSSGSGGKAWALPWQTTAQSATGFTIQVRNDDPSEPATVLLTWLAIGPE